MIAQYIEYFKNIAVNHPLLLHEDEHNKKSFYAIDFMELLGSFKNGIREKGLALYVLNYQSRFSQLGIEEFEGGFVVMSYFNKNLKGAKQGVYDLTETVVYQIIAQLQHDSNQLHPIWLDSLQHLDSFEKVAYKYAAHSDYVGWLVTFNFKQLHHMSQYVADYLPPSVEQSPIFTEGWIYLVNGLGVYKWTQPKTEIVIDASEMMGQYKTIKVQDIINEWKNSLRNLSDTFWSIEGHKLTLRFTETQQGTVWIAGVDQTDRQSYEYVVNEEGWFIIDFGEDIYLEGDELEVKIENANGDDIPNDAFEFDYATSQSVKVWLEDPTGDNASGVIHIRVVA